MKQGAQAVVKALDVPFRPSAGTSADAAGGSACAAGDRG